MREFRKPDITLISLGIVSLTLIFVGHYGIIELNDKNNYKYISSFGYFLQVIIWSLYYYKYHYKKTNNE